MHTGTLTNQWRRQYASDAQAMGMWRGMGMNPVSLTEPNQTRANHISSSLPSGASAEYEQLIPSSENLVFSHTKNEPTDARAATEQPQK